MGLRRTPLVDMHRRLGASLGAFAGYETAISFGSVIQEHLAVRRAVGVFDISHMTVIELKGKGWNEALDRLIPKATADLIEGRILGPTVFLNEEAGIKDDILIYKLKDGGFIIVGNAVNLDKDLDWLSRHAPEGGEVELLNEKGYCLLALQGPEAARLAGEVAPGAEGLGRMSFVEHVRAREGDIRVMSRSGWTGEDGFEFLAERSTAEGLFSVFIERGATPCGLAARDTLRLEMGYLLYGQDIDESVTPVEARYWPVFDYDKRGCIGCEALQKKLREGAERVRVGLKMKKGEKAIPRTGAEVYSIDEKIGVVTSGGYSPVLERPIAMAYVKASHALIGMSVRVNVRGKLYEAKIVDFPFI